VSVALCVRIGDRTDTGFTATAEYRLAGRTWQQPFAAAHVSDLTRPRSWHLAAAGDASLSASSSLIIVVLADQNIVRIPDSVF
jgi:hypothetical protein